MGSLSGGSSWNRRLERKETQGVDRHDVIAFGWRTGEERSLAMWSVDRAGRALGARLRNVPDK
jgi:hypothetical protein